MFIIPDSINVDLFKYLISYFINNNIKEISKSELKKISFDFLSQFDVYNINLATKNNKEKVIKRINKAFSRTLTYMKHLNIVENNRTNNIKISQEFLNLRKKFKDNFSFIIKSIIKKNYKELLNENNEINRYTVFNKLKEEYKDKEITKNTLIKYTNMLFYTLNDLLNNNIENIKIIEIIEKGQKSKKGFESVKEKVIDLILNNISNLDESEKTSIKKMLKETNFLEQVYEKIYNKDLANMIAAIINEPSLFNFENYEENIPNTNKAVEKINKYLYENKRILFISDTDNDGTSGRSIVDILKNVYNNDNIYNEYAIPSEETKHGISYQQVKEFFEKNNIKNNEKLLIVTIDNGANNLNEFKKILDEFPNVEIIVTDHHKPEYTLDEIKDDRITLVNHHFGKKAGFEPSGAETFAILAKKIIEENNNLNDINKKIILEHINNISAFSDIADMVKSQGPIFMNPELREKIGKNVNKLNAINTFESFLEHLYKGNLKDYLGIFLKDKKYNELNNNDKEVIDKYYENILLLEKYAYILNKNNLNIKDLNLNLLDINNQIIEKKGKYSNLFEIRPKIVSLLTKPFLTEEEKTLLEHYENLIELVKKIEKSLTYFFEEGNIIKFEEKNSKLVYTYTLSNDEGKNRKLINKLTSGNYNGILIMLDKYKNDKLEGSIRIKENILFEELLNTNLDKNKSKLYFNIKKSIKEELNKLGIDIIIRGHETGAAGIIIKNIKKGLKKIGWDGKKETEEIYLKKLLEIINTMFNQSYEKLLKKVDRKEKVEIKTNTEGLNSILEVLNVLKINNFTHGGKPNINFLLNIENFKIVDPEDKTQHIIVYKKNDLEYNKKMLESLKKYPENYFTTVLSFEGQNLIINKRMLLNAIEEKIKNKNNIYLSFSSISSTSFISNEVIPEKRKKLKEHLIIDNNIERNMNYSEYFNKENNYTIKFDSFEEFFNKNPFKELSKDNNKIIADQIKNLIKKTDSDEYIVVDVEGIGFGKNNLMFNIQLHRFTKKGKVITHAFFLDLNEINEKIAIPPSIVKLTGINEEIIKKHAVSIEFVSNFLKKILENKKILMTAHNNQYDKYSIATTLTGDVVDIILNKVKWFDSAYIAREEKLPESLEMERNPLFPVYLNLLNENGEVTNKIKLGNFFKDNKFYSFEEFIKTPFDGKMLVSEDKNSKLIIKEEGEGNFILYLKRNDTVNPIKIMNLKNLIIFKEEFEEENGKKRKKVYYQNSQGDKIKIDNYNNLFMIEYGQPLKNRKYSVAEILKTIGTNDILNYIFNNSLNSLDFDKFKNVLQKTSILDIDILIKKLEENIKFIIDFNCKNENEFIEENYKNIIKNININFSDLYKELEKKYSNLFNKISIIDNNYNFLEYLKNNNLLTKTELNAFEKLNITDNEKINKLFNKIISKKKTQQYYFNYLYNKTLNKEEVINIKNEIIKNLKLNNKNNSNFLTKIYNTVANNFINLKLKEIITKNIKKENNIDININNKFTIEKDIIKIILEEIYLVSEQFKYIDENIIRKLIFESYNSTLSVKDNIAVFKNKYYNFIPDAILEYLIEISNQIFQEIKLKYANYLNKNKITSLKEMYTEMHNNSSPFGSDTAFETFDIILALLYKKYTEIYPLFEKAILGEVLKNEKMKLKNVKPNTFSFKQLLNILEGQEDIDVTQNIYFEKQLKFIIEEYQNKKRIPIVIKNSNYTVSFKPNFDLNINEPKDLIKYKKFFDLIESFLNRLYNIDKILNTLIKEEDINELIFYNVFLKSSRNKEEYKEKQKIILNNIDNLIKERKKLISEIEKYGEFKVIENNIDSFFNNLKKTKDYNKNIEEVNLEFLQNKLNKIKEELSSIKNDISYLELKKLFQKEFLRKLPSLETLFEIMINEDYELEKKEDILKEWFYIIYTINDILLKLQENSSIQTFGTTNNSNTTPNTLKSMINNIIYSNIEEIKFSTEYFSEKLKYSQDSNVSF